MRNRNPTLKEHLGKVPKNAPFWYLAFILLLVWLWQSAVGQYAVRTIDYSDFKKALKSGEVTECVVKRDSVDGKIQPKPSASAAAARPSQSAPAPAEAQNSKPSGPPKAYLFHT